MSMGAYLMIITPGTPLLGAWVYGGAYDIKGYAFECRGVFTNLRLEEPSNISANVGAVEGSAVFYESSGVTKSKFADRAQRWGLLPRDRRRIPITKRSAGSR